MRTTLDLPEDLLIEAMKVTEIKTKTKVIITALEELIRKSKISDPRQGVPFLSDSEGGGGIGAVTDG
jgi:hypothetical protein